MKTINIDEFVWFCSEVYEPKSSPNDLIVHKSHGYFKGKACKHFKSSKERREKSGSEECCKDQDKDDLDLVCTWGALFVCTKTAGCSHHFRWRRRCHQGWGRRRHPGRWVASATSVMVPRVGGSCDRLGLSWTSCPRTACRFLNIDLTTHDDIGESGESQQILIWQL